MGSGDCHPRLTGERWVWVSLSYATFLLGAKDGTITDAPPIARKCLGRPTLEVAAYLRRRGAEFRPLPAVLSTPPQR